MKTNLGTFLDIARSLLVRDTIIRLRQVDALFFSPGDTPSVTLEGRLWDRLEDSIAADWRQLGFSEARVAHAFTRIGGQLAHGNPVFINRAAALGHLSSRILGKRPSSTSIKLYSRILRQANPSIVFTNNLPPALPCAARSLDIPVVELLHGKGYATIPWGWNETPQEHLPDAVMAFDAVSARTFRELESKGVKTIYAEDPWIKRFRDDPSSLPVEWQWPRSLSEGWARVVLVSLQWNDGNPNKTQDQNTNLFENKPFLTTLKSVIDKTDRDTLWLFRLHPIQLRGAKYAKTRRDLKELAKSNPNVEWLHASTLPLPAVLNSATHHVSIRSGSTYEAAMMGVPSAVLSPEVFPGNALSSGFEDLRKAGYVTLVDMRQDQDLLDWLLTAELRTPFTSGNPMDVKEALTGLAGDVRGR